MKTCFKCGEQFRDVWQLGRIVPLNQKDDKIHWKTCAAKGPNKRRTRKKRRDRAAKVERAARRLSRSTIHKPADLGQETCHTLPPARQDQPQANGIAGRINRDADARLTLRLDPA